MVFLDLALSHKEGFVYLERLRIIAPTIFSVRLKSIITVLPLTKSHISVAPCAAALKYL